MDLSLPLLTIAGVVLVWLLIKLLSAPIRWAFKLLLHMALGFAALFLLNYLGAAVGVTLPLTWVNALVTGLLGLPGVLILLVFHYIF